MVAKINIAKRIETAYNHTATHLLHAALKQVLGAHVNQKGSLVSEQVLRFDMAHFSKVTEEELQKVTNIVNRKIRENIPVVIRELPKEEAIAMGAMALFGEKYGDVVRTVIIDPEYSIELCGGTHVGYTGEIGTFVITSESAVAAGVRRIEAMTGQKALDYLLDKATVMKEIAESMKTKDVQKAFHRLLEDKAALEKQITALEQQNLTRQAGELAKNAIARDDYQVLIQKVEAGSMEVLKKLAHDTKAKLENAFVMLYAITDGKPLVAVAISDTLAREKKHPCRANHQVFHCTPYPGRRRRQPGPGISRRIGCKRTGWN
ncbi:MAG: hypothetical protein KL787_04800 [Taibaiella sp.]|nr:hypothetical protein [Taibaiella sp.]